LEGWVKGSKRVPIVRQAPTTLKAPHVVAFSVVKDSGRLPAPALPADDFEHQVHDPLELNLHCFRSAIEDGAQLGRAHLRFQICALKEMPASASEPKTIGMEVKSSSHQRRFVNSFLFKKNFCHHAFVFVV